jgi:hypothetical protein
MRRSVLGLTDPCSEPKGGKRSIKQLWEEGQNEKTQDKGELTTTTTDRRDSQLQKVRQRSLIC